MRTIKDQKGIALVTALFFLVIVTALASGAIMLATVQLKVSGSVSWWESGFSAAEGGVNYSIPLVLSLYHDEGIPAVYRNFVIDPVDFEAELTSYETGGHDRDRIITIPPTPPTPDVVKDIGAFTVSMDVDLIGTIPLPAEDVTPSDKYTQASALGANAGVYRVSARAVTPDNRIVSSVEQVILAK